MTRAVVLGGGGVTGIAWEIGMLTGLAEAGVDLTEADLFVGTSAGSAVACMVAGSPLRDRYKSQLDGSLSGKAVLGAGLLARYAWAMLRSRTSEGFGARMGRLALAATTVSHVERRAVIEERLRVHDWPEHKRVLVTAVDAESGEFKVFDRDSGVALSDAVAASCAVPGVWPPAEIDGRRYIDGGMRSVANADLAAGCDRVVVIAPIIRGGGPVPSPQRQVAALRTGGAKVVLIAPDQAARRAIGRNVLDPARRRPAAEAGFAQAATVVESVRGVWV